LSRKPEHIRKRIRNRAEPLAEDVAMLAESIGQMKPLAEWDLEELARGKPRNPSGDFRGRPPVWITPALRTEAARRLKVEALAFLSGHVEDAIKVLVDLMTSSTDERVQIDCAKFIIEHVVGKAKQSVDLEMGEGVRGMLAKALVTRNKITGALVDAHPVVDLEPTEWTDEDDDDV
jgi:hypothetical protein